MCVYKHLYVCVHLYLKSRINFASNFRFYLAIVAAVIAVVAVGACATASNCSVIVAVVVVVVVACLPNVWLS